MTPEEILERMKLLKNDDHILINKLNDNWEAMDGLRRDYKKQTGKEL